MDRVRNNRNFGWLVACCFCLAAAVPLQAMQTSGSASQENNPVEDRPNLDSLNRGHRGHAHNDYQHPQPLTEALERGFGSIEADVFLVDGNLLVGHSRWELTPERTLRKLYLDPLQKLSEAGDGMVLPGGGELILLVDFKADGELVYAKLKELLADYPQLISTFDDGVYHRRAVRIVISGDRPVEAIRADAGHMAGIDGRISDLDSTDSRELMPLISESWSSHFRWRGRGDFPDQERQKLREIAARAHVAGRRLRFWATPESSQVWSELLAAKVDLIGTDQLQILQDFLLKPVRADEAKATDHELEKIERIALLACIRQKEPVPALKKYVELKAGLHLWLGDNIYADTKELAELQDCYAKLKSQPFFDALRSQGIHLATWDDHDFGWNDAGKHYPLKVASQHEFRKFWKLEKAIPADQQGIYYSQEFAVGSRRLQVLMLDVRYHRDDPGLAADILGAAQWTWLEEQLSQPADLRLLVSGFQILLGPDTGSESWSQFPQARQRLFDLIRERKVENLIFVTGDQHYGEVSRLRGALGYDAVEFQFAGLNQIEDPEFNPWRVSSVCQSKHSYAWLDIQWETSETDVPHIVFRIHNADDETPELIYRVNFSELVNQ